MKAAIDAALVLNIAADLVLHPAAPPDRDDFIDAAWGDMTPAEAVEGLMRLDKRLTASDANDLSALAPLLWLLWHHQGGHSPVGQPIRKYLGMGQFESMTLEQVEAAKKYREQT